MRLGIWLVEIVFSNHSGLTNVVLDKELNITSKLER